MTTEPLPMPIDRRLGIADPERDARESRLLDGIDPVAFKALVTRHQFLMRSDRRPTRRGETRAQVVYPEGLR